MTCEEVCFLLESSKFFPTDINIPTMQLNDATTKCNQSITDLVPREHSPSLSVGRNDSTSSLLKLLVSDDDMPVVLSNKAATSVATKKEALYGNATAVEGKAIASGEGVVLFPKVVVSPRHQCDQQLVWSGHSIAEIVHDRAMSHENFCFLTNMGDDVFLVESDCESFGCSTDDLYFAGFESDSVGGADHHGNLPPLVDHFREMRFFT
jgi:hypothetical protein